MMKILAVVGQPSSGKDTVAEYIASKGYAHISSGNVIREEMTLQGLPLDRESMSTFSSERRSEVGNEYPVPIFVTRITGDTVISGLRNSAEIDFLKNKFAGDFVVIAVEAPIESRYHWAKLRGRASDDISFEQFKKEEEVERMNNVGYHEVDKVVAMADRRIVNDSTKEDLFLKTDAVIKTLQ